MAKTERIGIQLDFKANTQNVKKNLTDLQSNLKKITNMEVGLKSDPIDVAIRQARTLQTALDKAINVDTGRLDLNKFTKEIKQAGLNMHQLSLNMQTIGPTGTQTFVQLAEAINMAELPSLKLNKTFKDFLNNIGNSMKWQIAQTATQTIQSTLSNAVREAEQLNTALNDIRIVTGYDATAMAQFAKEANRAAKELKTTTKQYAEASLIFYQQGLSGSEVSKRAETVIKLSQVTGDSAKTVSDQMTAIWNNFDNGTKSLEYYADAMAKLGADTAASTSEIANGLEKFAAIAETVGLSYETAMASVATVIDKTRQSADVVGTAFKTIFARVQGLSLDGVTDDGVSLNKYSKALEAVGVDVLTASGELRNMDAILEDLGSKWKGLGKETQVAVAQTVGGARQYNQILSLMDNWQEVQSNINKAMESSGELDTQAEIWGESYEAAAERVEEAKARLSENFLNSDDVVAITNIFADLIEGVDKFIDRMGGIVPILTMITMMFSKKLLPLVKTGLRASVEGITTVWNNVTGKSEKNMSQMQKQVAAELQKMESRAYNTPEKRQLELTKEMLLVREKMSKAVKSMSAQEQEAAMYVLDKYEKAVQKAKEAQQKLIDGEKKSKEGMSRISESKVKEAAAKNIIKKSKKFSEEEIEALESKGIEQVQARTKWAENTVTEAEKKRENARTRAKTAEAQANAAKTKTNEAKVEAEDSRKTARDFREIAEESKDKVGQAEKDFGQAKQRERNKQEKLSLAEQSVEKAKQRYDNAQVDLALAQEAGDKTAIVKMEKQAEAAKLALTKAEDQVESAKTVLNQAEAQVEEAKALLEEIKEKAKSDADLANEAEKEAVKKEEVYEEARKTEGEAQSNYEAAKKEKDRQESSLTKAEEQLAEAEEEEELKLQYEADKAEAKSKIKAKTPEEIRKVSFGQAEGFASDENYGENTDESNYYGDIKKARLDVSTEIRGAKEQADWDGQNSFEVSIKNYEILSKKAAEYEATLIRIRTVNDDMDYLYGQDKKEMDDAAAAEEKANIEINDAKTEVAQLEEEVKKDPSEENTKKLTEAKNRLIKADKDLKNAQDRTRKASDELNASTRNSVKWLKQSRDRIKELAKQAGLSDDNIRELENAFDQLDEKPEEALDNITKKLLALETATESVQGDFQQLSNDIRDSLTENLGPEAMAPIDEGVKTTREGIVAVAEAEKEVSRNSEDVNEKLNGSKTSFESIATGAMEAAGAMMGLYSGVQSLVSAFTESTSAGEFFTNFLGSLMTMIPAVIGVFELFGKAKEKLAERTVRANNKQQISEVTESAVNVTGEMAEGVAEINPPKIAAAAIGLGIIGALGIGGAIIAGVGGAIGKGKDEKQHEQDTATIEATEKSNELATASIKESNAIDDLTLEYNKLAEAKMNTAEITEDIIDQLDTVVKSYQDYRKEVEMAVDAEKKLANIEEDIKSKTLELEAASTTEERTAILADINKQRREADKLIAETAVEQSNAGQKAVLREIQYKESQGEFTDTRMVKGHVERQAGHAGDTEIGDYLEKNYSSIVDVVHGGFLGIGDTVYFKIDTSSPENFIADYGKLKEAVDWMAGHEDIGINNDVYREANELLTELTPSYEQLSTFVESEEAQQIVLNASKLGTGETTGTFGSVVKPEDIKNYQDYKQYISNVAGTDDVNSEEYIASKQYVDSLEGMSQYAQLSSKIRGVVGETDKDGNYKVTNKELKDYLEGLNPEDYEFFLKVNTNIFDTQKEIEEQIPIIKKEVESENIQLKIKGIYEIADKIKPEGMTAEDWAAIGENEVFAGNSEAFKEFLGKSYAEQLAYLYGQTGGYERDLFKKWEEQEIAYKNAMKNYADDSEEYEYYKQKLEALEIEKLTWEAINRESVKYIKNLKKSDVFDIYHDLNNELDKLKNQYEELQEIINNTFGIQQLNAYKDMIVNLQAQQKKLKEFAEVDKAEIGLEKNILSKQIKELLGDNLNTTIEFDEEGRINNYTKFFTEYYDYLDTLEKSGQSYDEAVRSQIEELISNYQDLWKTYDDRQQSIKEAENKEKTTRYQEIGQQLELKLDLDSIEMKEVEYQFEKLSKTISTVADVVKLFGDKMANIEDSLGYYDSYVDALDADMAASKITQSDYVEGLKKAHDAIYDQLQAMESLKEEIINYYGETLQKAQEEIDKYANRIDHATSVLNHYKTILELTGKATSTQTRTVLEGITAVAKSNLDVARKEYEFYNQQAIQTKAALDAYVAEHGDSLDKDQDFEYQILEKQWLDATEAMENAQEEMLSKTAEWGEAMKAQVEYDMQELAKSLEKAFTGGVSFDELTASMERASLLQEDYLTTTNKIYETTKLMRTAQNAIDASTNNIAKQKLKGFVEETKQLQSQGKLSSVELDIQQKKYDLLVAEIALQDAQNAKSTVRLTRTADGGFGYVYTADENKIGEAQQQYEDADNALYNARLEAANSYAEKSIQTQQEFTQTMAELDQQRLDGTITSEEEFQRRRDELVAFYTQRLKDFSTIYSVAIQGDSRITQEAWSTDFANMVTDTDNWQNAVSNYIDATDARFREWEAVVDEIEQSTGTDLNSMAGNVGKVTDEAKGLADQLSKDGGTIDQVQGLIDKVQIFITQQADIWAEKVGALTEKYEDLAKQIKEAIKAQSELEGPKGPGSENNIDPFAEKNAIIQKWKDIGKLASEGKAEEAISMYENWAYGQAQGKNYQGQLKTAINLAATNQSAKDLFTQLSSSGEQISLGTLYDTNRKIEKEENILNNTIGQKIVSQNRTTIPIYECTDEGVKRITGLEYYIGSGNGAGGKKILDAKKINNEFYFKTAANVPYKTYGGNTEYQDYWVKYSDITLPEGFDTGGYTGSWGPEGKFAMLHQKEIILNADDTTNFLASLDLLHSILKTIDIQAANAQFSSSLTSSYFTPTTSEILEQNVHIEASFPGVSDHNEVELALTNLINQASQYANRK